MTDPSTTRSPSPSTHGYSLGRRRFIKGAAGAAGAGLILPAALAACGGDDDDDAGSGSDGTTAPEGTAEAPAAASGDLSIGSRLSNEAPEAGLAAAVEAFPNQDVNVTINTTDSNTFQENISTYLQNPDDVIAWFAGYRMRFFAAQGIVPQHFERIGAAQLFFQNVVLRDRRLKAFFREVQIIAAILRQSDITSGCIAKLVCKIGPCGGRFL